MAGEDWFTQAPKSFYHIKHEVSNSFVPNESCKVHHTKHFPKIYHQHDGHTSAALWPICKVEWQRNLVNISH